MKKIISLLILAIFALGSTNLLADGDAWSTIQAAKNKKEAAKKAKEKEEAEKKKKQSDQ